MNDEAAVLRVHMEAGTHHIRALLSGAGGEYRSAYYVYVRAV